MSPRGLLPCKNAGILAAHGTPLKCRESGLLPSTGHFGPPSDDLDASKHFFKKAFQLRTFFLAAFWLPSRWPRDTVKMQGFELAATLVLPSDFQNFFWGPRRASGDPDKRGNRSVLSPSLRGRLAEQNPFIFARDYEASTPPTL